MTRKETIKQLRKEADAVAQKIYPTYQFLKWEWEHDKVRYIPSVYDLKVNILSLLGTLEEDNKSFHSSSGGIEVRIWKEFKNEWHGSIYFMDGVEI